jgi:hypothetical protein
VPWIAAAVAGSAVIGAGTSLLGSSTAAGSAEDAAALQRQQYQQTRGDLQPYFEPGRIAVANALDVARSGPTGGGPDYLSAAWAAHPGRMTQAELEATPGYQFTLAQGLKSTQSAAAARGLGVSGAALKGAGEYATQLANKTYLDQFNVAQKGFEDWLNLNTGQQTNVQNQYNRLAGIATLGANAAAGLGTQGTSSASTAGNYINQGGLATAAGYQGVGNALTGAANNYLAYDAYKSRTGGYVTDYSQGGPGGGSPIAAGNY